MITTQDIFVGELNTILDFSCGQDLLMKKFIDKYDPQIIKDVVGQSLYNEIKTALENPLVGEMNTLINGGDYSVDGVAYHFKGFKHITAGFIFYWYHRNNAFEVAQTGGKSPSYASETPKSMNFKMWSAWNEATALIGFKSNKTETLNHFLKNSDFVYTLNEYKGGRIKGLQWL